MVHESTANVVRRVLPLIEHFSDRTIDKARMLQYLSARAGIDWGTLYLVEELEEAQEFGPTLHTLVVRDRLSGDVNRVRRPDCIPQQLDDLVLEEYKRLALRNSLAGMNPELFNVLFGESFCHRCEWRGELFDQFHRECHYAGRPVNFKLRTSGGASSGGV